MRIKLESLWLLALLCDVGNAITLLQVLQTYPDLSSLFNYVNASSNATSLLASANNFTFLAPSNTAISDFVKANGNSSLNADFLQANLQYGMLKGGYPSLSFTNESLFVKTGLSNGSYANVTGGQVVELRAAENGDPEVVSGDKKISSSTSAVRIYFCFHSSIGLLIKSRISCVQEESSISSMTSSRFLSKRSSR